MKVLIISLLVVLSVSASLVSACMVDDDCPKNQCCAGTPNGPYVCLPYHELGEQCHFMHRQPVCYLASNNLAKLFNCSRAADVLPVSTATTVRELVIARLLNELDHLKFSKLLLIQ